jgi:hypothetical protein
MPPRLAIERLVGRTRLRAGRLRAAFNDWRDGDVPPITDPMVTCFVVGCGNSGTTLVAARLGNHPAIHVLPTETTVLRPRRRLGQARRRLTGWIAAARAAGAAVLVEKTPKHIHDTARIRRLLPEARLVIVQRSPFDTCLSLAKRHGGLDRAIVRWCLDNAPALELPEDGLTTRLRYEALTAAPEAEFRRILAFLGLPWDEAVLAAGATAYGGVSHRMPTMRLRAQQVAEPIRPNSGKWRTELAPAEIARIRAATGPLFAALGGDPETGTWREITA